MLQSKIIFLLPLVALSFLSCSNSEINHIQSVDNISSFQNESSVSQQINEIGYSDKGRKSISDIDSNDRSWNAPLLYQIVTNFYYADFHNLKIRIWPFGGRDCYADFENSVFERELFDETVHSDGFELWLYDVGRYDEFQNTVKVILEQYRELADRLTILRQNRELLNKKYNDCSFTKPIDEDIVLLTSLGLDLGKTTIQFFTSAKKQMQKNDLAIARTKGFQGMKTFPENIDFASSDPSKPLENSINSLIEAVQERNKAMNQ